MGHARCTRNEEGAASSRLPVEGSNETPETPLGMRKLAFVRHVAGFTSRSRF